MCGKAEVETEAMEEESQKLDYSSHELPKDIKWITND